MQGDLKSQNKILFKIAENRKNQVYFLIFSVLSIATMVTIFVFSAQSAELSATLSGEFAGRLQKLLNSLKWLLSDGIIEWIFTHIRKIAHFTLYALLGCFVSAGLLNTKIKSVHLKCVISAAVCLFYSITDEFHQLFVDGRSGELLDVLIDFSGAATGILLTLVIYKIICIFSKNLKKV